MSAFQIFHGGNSAFINSFDKTIFSGNESFSQLVSVEVIFSHYFTIVRYVGSALYCVTFI